MTSKPLQIPTGSISRCLFTHEIFHSVDDAVDRLYKERGKRAPFGDFRRTWWRYHCLQLSGPDNCPYEPRDCALAFYRVAQLSVDATRPGAMFRVIARDHAVKRLEGKPLARDQESRSPFTRPKPRGVEAAQGPGDESGPDQRLLPPASGHSVALGEDGLPVHRPLSRPVRIGTLLGRDYSRSREVPADDREEGT